jgi:putative membrane protein
LLALLVLAGREIHAIFRQRHIALLHIALARAHEADDRDAAREEVGELAALYENRPETANARKSLADLRREIIDGRDLIDIAERLLMTSLDAAARAEIAAAAKRVSLVAALSPRAIVDVVFVAAQALRLIRRIAEIYGGRPGLLGVWRLARAVGSHLAITGGMAVGDSLMQQILGHGIAAKISARLGEGVLNGLLTARIGLSAMAVCRPMPFFGQKPPGVRDVAPFLLSDGGEKKAAAEPPRNQP